MILFPPISYLSLQALVQCALERIAGAEKLADRMVLVTLFQFSNDPLTLWTVQMGSQRWVHRSGEASDRRLLS